MLDSFSERITSGFIVDNFNRHSLFVPGGFRVQLLDILGWPNSCSQDTPGCFDVPLKIVVDSRVVTNPT